MKRPLVAVKLVLLASCAGISAAYADQWNFTFHNLHHTYTDLMTDETIDYGFASIDGYFTGFDDNNDGVISRNELDQLYFGGGEPYEVGSFTYGGGNQLSFQAYGYRSYVDTTSGYYGGSGGYTVAYRLGPTSYITAASAPVPEPGSSALLCVGFIALGGVHVLRPKRAG